MLSQTVSERSAMRFAKVCVFFREAFTDCLHFHAETEAILHNY